MTSLRRYACALLLCVLGLPACGGGNGSADGGPAAPDSAIPDASVPDGAAPDGAAPDTTGPDAPRPDAAGPDAPLADTTGPDETPAQPGIGDGVLDPTRVHVVRLTLSPADLADLEDYSQLVSDGLIPEVVSRYVPAQLDYDGATLDPIAVRYKGDQSITACIDDAGQRQVKVMAEYGGIDICAKFSLKLDFDRLQPDNRLDGLKKLNLHAMAADATKMHEMLGYHLFRAFGVPAPRTAYVRLYVNDVSRGLYLAVEQVDGRFTAARFPDGGDGNLYKEVWPAEEKTVAQFLAALKTNEEAADVSDMLALRDALARADDETFATDLAAFLDFDALARYVVVDRGIANFDGFLVWYGLKIGEIVLGAYNHNYYWYHDPTAGRFTLIPWDLDKTFLFPEPIFWSALHPAGDPGVVPNWNVVTGSCAGYDVNFDPPDTGGYGVRELDCDKFIRLLRATIAERLAPLAAEFTNGVYAPSNVTPLVEAWRTLIAPEVAQDVTDDAAHWQQAVDALLRDLPRHRENLTALMAELRPIEDWRDGR